MSENGEIYTAGKNFTLPPAVTAWTNSTSDDMQSARFCKIIASSVNFSIFTHFLCFFLLKLLKLGEIDGVNFLA